MDMQQSSSDFRPSRQLSRKPRWRQKSVGVEGPLGARGRLGRQKACPEANLDTCRGAVLGEWAAEEGNYARAVSDWQKLSELVGGDERLRVKIDSLREVVP